MRRLFALAVLLLMGFAATRFRMGDFGMSESVGFGLGFATLLLFAVVFLFIAARGLYQDRMPVMGSGPDITFAQRRSCSS